MSKPPIFMFCFEGIDGAGKSSLLEAVATTLRRIFALSPEGLPRMEVECYRLPCQDVPIGGEIRGAVKRQLLSTEQEILGLTMNRSQVADFLRRTIVDAGRHRSTIVLMDRWGGTCSAYQGTDAPHLAVEISKMHKRFVGLEPLRTYLVDTDPQVALQRMAQSRPSLDPNEVDILRQGKISSHYMELAMADNTWRQLNGEYPTERLAAMVVEDIFAELKKHELKEDDHENSN